MTPDGKPPVDNKLPILPEELLNDENSGVALDDDTVIVPGTVDSRLALLELPDQINQLKDPQKRLIAMLGIKNPSEAKMLPANYRVVEIKVDRGDKKALQEALSDPSLNAVQINTGFDGDSVDNKITSSYVIPYTEPGDNAQAIVRKLMDSGVRAEASVSTPPTLIMRVNGSGIITLGTRSAPIVAGDPKKKLELANPEMDPTASTKSVESAMNEKRTAPREGLCAYLAIDQEIIQDLENLNNPYVKLLIKKLKNISSADPEENNYHVTSRGGYLIIVNTAEQKAGDALLKLANELNALSDGKMKALVGEATVVSDNDNFYFIGDASDSDLNYLSIAKPGINLTEGIYDSKAKALTQRTGGSLEVKVSQGEFGMHRLESISSKISLHIGGPDKMIGLEDEFKKVNTALNDDKTGLIVLEGTAGMGKSRLLSEVVKENPSTLVLSLDPSGRKIPGYSMVRVFEQVADYVEKNTGSYGSNKTLALIKDFAAKSQEAKIEAAQKNPRVFSELLLKAFEFLRSQNGELKILLDDMHYTDRHSDVHLTRLLSRLLMNNEEEGTARNKIIISRRPEEFQSQIQKDFEKRWEEKSSKVAVGGLDFNDPEISHEYVLHSLPVDLRGLRLGEWHKTIGAKAGTFPLAMTVYMNEIISAHEKALAENRVSPLKNVNGTLELDESFIATLQDKIMNDADLDRHYKEKLKPLSKEERSFMDYLALLGGKINPASGEIYGKVLGFANAPDPQAMISKLVSGTYIFRNGKSEFEVFHPSFVPSILDSMSAKGKIDMSTKLMEVISGDATIHRDIIIALLHNIAPAMKGEDLEFWKKYSTEVGFAFEDMQKKASYVASYDMAQAVFGEKDSKGALKNEFMKKTLRDMENGEDVPEPIRRIITQSLFTTICNAGMIGKFEEVLMASSSLDLMANSNPELIKDLDMVKAKEAIFNAYNMLALFNPKVFLSELKRYFEEEVENDSKIPESYKLNCRIKLFWRSNKMAGEARDLYSAKESRDLLASIDNPDSPEYQQFTEISVYGKVVIPFEMARKGIEVRHDEDVMMNKEAVREDERKIFDGVKEELRNFQADKEKYATAFTPLTEMRLLDSYAQEQAFEGNVPEAVQAFSEYCWQATQMEMFSEAVRAGKLKGDVQMMDALSSHLTNAKKAREATRTYREEIGKLLGQISQESFYQFSGRIQPIRSTIVSIQAGLRDIDSGRKSVDEIAESKKEMKADLERLINEDFKYLMDHKESFFKRAGEEDSQYYVSSYLGYVADMAKKLDVVLPVGFEDVENNPFMNISQKCIDKTAEILKNIAPTDKVSFREVNTKMKGQRKVLQLRVAKLQGEPQAEATRLLGELDRLAA